LEDGKVYEIAVFQAERQSDGSSYKLTLGGFNTAPNDSKVPTGTSCPGPNSDDAYGGCTTKCTWGGYCGDGIVNGTEECDNGKDNGTKNGEGGCTLGCTKQHYCGDGHVDTDRKETCDLGDRNGQFLDSQLNPATGPDTQIYCKTDCTIPTGIVR
jgi:hypothetical protein